MRCAVAFMAMFSLTAIAADDKKDMAIKQEFEKLQGKWKQVSSETGGKTRDIPSGLASVVTIKDDKWTMALGSKAAPVMTLSIDPTQNPKHWDRVIKDSDGKEGKGVTDKCIYKLDGDTLTIRTNRTLLTGKPKDDTERPKEFKTTEGGSVAVYKRVET